MKKSIELRKQLKAIESEMAGLLDVAKTEERAFTDAEQTDFDAKFEKVEALKRSIESAEKVEAFEARQAANAGVTVPNISTGKKEAYSLVGHIDAVRKGKLEGVYAEAQAQGERELRASGVTPDSNAVYVPANYTRDFTVTGDSGAKGGNTVATQTTGIIETLFEGSLLNKLGASKMLGLTGNVKMPKGASVVSSWVTENGTIINLTPNRLATRMFVSNQLLIQTSGSVETYLRKEIEKSIQKSIDEKYIAYLLADSSIQAVVNGTNGAALTVAKVNEFIELAAKADADLDKAKFLINYDIFSALKALPKASGSDRFMLENGMIDGTKGTGEGLSAMVFGDFSSAIVAGWGAIEILVDPYTAAADGETILNVGSYWDLKDAHAEAKAVSKDIVA
jgi:HK97 family phage major capsid protein